MTATESLDVEVSTSLVRQIARLGRRGTRLNLIAPDSGRLFCMEVTSTSCQNYRITVYGTVFMDDTGVPSHLGSFVLDTSGDPGPPPAVRTVSLQTRRIGTD